MRTADITLATGMITTLPRLALFLLIALGALAGILLAPKSGRGTRHPISTEVDDGRKYVTYLGRKTREEVANMVEFRKDLLTK